MRVNVQLGAVIQRTARGRRAGVRSHHATIPRARGLLGGRTLFAALNKAAAARPPLPRAVEFCVSWQVNGEPPAPRPRVVARALLSATRTIQRHLRSPAQFHGEPLFTGRV